jgi:hypothetical protein
MLPPQDPRPDAEDGRDIVPPADKREGAEGDEEHRGDSVDEQGGHQSHPIHPQKNVSNSDLGFAQKNARLSLLGTSHRHTGLSS